VEGRIKLLTLQKIRRAAFQGEEGAFSEQAARKFFGNRTVLVPAPTFERVFELVHAKKVDAGVLPIENTLHGSILENYDLLQKFDLTIIAEVKLRVVHHLMSNRGASLRKLRTVYSHPQALSQCGRFLSKLPSLTPLPFYDTAGAARFIKDEKLTNAAAIASDEAARVYRLKILARGIENNKKNFTRFLILARNPVRVTDRAKTSVVFSVRNVPGSLLQALKGFADLGINLHKIESRPVIGKPWEYLFYLDFGGDIADGRSQTALRTLRKVAKYVKVLGSYREG
jgi:prephenate dehydratase